MHIEIVSVGKIKQSFVQDAENEYLPRIRKYSKVSVSELDLSKFAKLPDKQRQRRETEEVLNYIKPGTFLIALDEDGRQFTSEAFANLLDEKTVGGISSFCFAIGGANGWDKELMRSRAGLFLSLSKFTLSYQVSRMVLAEQLYRVISIMKGLPYHKQ